MAYSLEEKTIAELIEEVNASLKACREMTIEEELENDAEYGYFEDD